MNLLTIKFLHKFNYVYAFIIKESKFAKRKLLLKQPNFRNKNVVRSLGFETEIQVKMKNEIQSPFGEQKP